MARIGRKLILIMLDIILISSAVFISYGLRFDFRIPVEYLRQVALVVGLMAPVAMGLLWRFGLYDRVWRYASVEELISVVKASLISSIYVYVIRVVFSVPIPRSVILGSLVLNTGLIGASRLVLRLRSEIIARFSSGGARKVLIFGAGDAGEMVAKEIGRRPELGMRVECFVDDDPVKQGLRIRGIPVAGTRHDIAKVVGDKGIDDILIAIPSAGGGVIREIMEICKGTTARLKTVPGIYELIDGKVEVSEIRNVEIEDLLGREPVEVDLSEVGGYLQGEVVLVTGAGGSIGLELCRQVLGFGPRELILLGHGENSIFEAERELRGRYPNQRITSVIADIKDAKKMDRLFGLFEPGVVFHAAAHKHVPLMELNPDEAITNNIFGTRNACEASLRYGVKRFVLVSTDKAVNPVNVMGVSKRIAEMIVQTMAGHGVTKFMAVRFGNVLGSRGSVVRVFKEQIARGGPVTVTHPEMTRYFMTIPEAVQLIIQTGHMGEGGEVFVLDMGRPVKIVDLARDLIRLSGFEPDKDIRIEIVGARPGERLKEETLTQEEGIRATRHKRIYIARPDGVNRRELELALRRLEEIVVRNDIEGMGRVLGSLVPTYRMNEDVMNEQRFTRVESAVAADGSLAEGRR